jgi:hypothetical protein
MSTPEEERIERNKAGLEECKIRLKKLAHEWGGCTDMEKNQFIIEMVIYISLCSCFTSITAVFVDTIFHENGGWESNHEFTTRVKEQLGSWGHAIDT